MPVNTGSCTTLQELAKEVNEALTEVAAGTTVVIGTVGTVPYGDPPTVTDGTPGDPATLTLDFEFPLGASGGEDGDDGVTPAITVGTVTTVAYTEDAAVTDVGTAPDAEFNFEIPRGVPGDQGNPGTTPTFTGGTVTDLAYGTPPTAVVVDNTPTTTYKIDFGIPRGPAGAGGGDTSLQPMIIVEIRNTQGDSGTLLGAYNSDDAGLLPVAIGSTLDIYDTQGYGLNLFKGQTWVCGYSIEDDQYELLFQLSECLMLKGTLVNDVDSTDMVFTVENLETCNGRLPKNTSGVDYTQVTVDNSVSKTYGIAGDAIYLLYSREAGNGSNEQDQWVPIPRPQYNVIKGVTLSAIGTGDSSMSLTSVEAVRGPSPGASVSVANDPVCVFPAGATVYAAYTETNASYNWDTGDAHNHEAIHRGLSGWDLAAKQHVEHDAASYSLVWVDNCLHDTVIGVEATATKLQYTYHEHDSCTIETAEIIDIGECDA